MRWFAIGVLLVVACSKEESKPRDPEGSGSPVVPVDAEPPPPMEIEGVPVAYAIPSKYTGYAGFAMDVQSFYLCATDVLAVPRAGGAPKVLITISLDQSTETDLIKPSNEEELRRMTADRPDVAAALRGAKSYEYAKSYQEAAVHGGYLYLSNWGTSARKNADATVERVPIGGGAVEILAKNIPDGVDDLYVDDAAIFIVTGKSAILRMPHAGGAPVTLYPAPTSTLEARYLVALGGDSFFVSESTLDADFAHKNATITRVPKAGGAAKVIIPKLPSSVQRLVADATSVYWMDGKQTGVYRTDHAAKAKPKMVAKGYGESDRIHGKFLYRIVEDHLVRTPVAGGAEERLRKLPDHTSILAIEDTAVFLSNNGIILRHDVR